MDLSDLIQGGLLRPPPRGVGSQVRLSGTGGEMEFAAEEHGWRQPGGAVYDKPLFNPIRCSGYMVGQSHSAQLAGNAGNHGDE